MKAKKFLVILLTSLVFLAGAVLGVATVYRVDEICVDASTISDEAEAEAQDLQARLIAAYEKQSIFSAEATLAEEIIADFPYFRMSQFEKAYPNRIVVHVTEDVEVYAIENGAGQYYILGGDGTVLGIRDEYSNRSDETGKSNNLLVTGVSVTGQKGEIIRGDENVTSLLSFCQKVDGLLNGIRRNITAIELKKGGSSQETILLKLSTFEGVTIYINNPSVQTERKAEIAVNEYLGTGNVGLTDLQRTCGMLLVTVSDATGDVQTTYHDKDIIADATQNE